MESYDIFIELSKVSLFNDNEKEELINKLNDEIKELIDANSSLNLRKNLSIAARYTDATSMIKFADATSNIVG